MTNVLEFLLLAKDEASDAFDKVSKKVESVEGRLEKFRGVATVASGIAAVAIAKFAGDSVSAYTEAEQQQTLLENAYSKFNLNVPIEQMRAFNSEIQKKTGYDDDAFASGQAALAQYGLTGEQIQQVTPLVADFAAKTGTDLNTAFEQVGKSMLGQGKALKSVGVDFQDTGSVAGNFEQVMAGLSDKVGGTAEVMGGTAAGKAQILATQFENIQETVGGLLVPVLSTLVEVGSGVVTWLNENPPALMAVGIALGVLTLALIGLTVATWASNLAFLASPITWIILGVVALVAAIVWLVMNWDMVVAWITEIWGGFIGWITGVIDGFVGWWNGVWAGFASWIGQVWQGFITWISDIWNGYVAWLMGVVNGIATWWNSVWQSIGNTIGGIWNGIVSAVETAINWVSNVIQVGLGLIKSGWDSMWNGLGSVVRGIWNGILGAIEGGVNGAIGIINGLINAVNSVSGVVGITVGTIPRVGIPRLATGTVTNGPMLAMIGDNPGGREVVQPVSTYQEELRRAYESGQNRSSGGGDRPIYADGMGLIGWVREVANGEAQLVWNTSEQNRARVAKQGKLAYP